MSCVRAAEGWSTLRAFRMSYTLRMASPVALRAAASSPFTFALSLSTRTLTSWITFCACCWAFVTHSAMPSSWSV